MVRNPTLLALLEILTVGLPFCIFKLLSGLLLGRWGYPLLVLGALDLCLNLGNVLALLVERRRTFPICTANLLAFLLGRRDRHWSEMAAAVDVALSFLLVAVVVGGNFLRLLPGFGIAGWSTAVVLNVLGAGLSQVNQAYIRLQALPEAPEENRAHA
ncbi:hypothetical protein [Mesoterricola silvestris]|uniref:Uncharacterized protein n=1 Tax=Mesoterricola silvestris TaxID=2927979 RepID=A0AA48K703_9BACT|nr:hypothetical protein [Mesoterricola silvestris]BDU71344.1 hypothetical protein METEAL_05180 [Mesoterricola silvestris]